MCVWEILVFQNIPDCVLDITLGDWSATLTIPLVPHVEIMNRSPSLWASGVNALYPQEWAEAAGQPVGVSGFRILAMLEAFQNCLHLQVGFFWEMLLIKGRDILHLIAFQKGKVMCWEWILRAPLSYSLALARVLGLLLVLILKLLSKESLISVL